MLQTRPSHSHEECQHAHRHGPPVPQVGLFMGRGKASQLGAGGEGRCPWQVLQVRFQPPTRPSWLGAQPSEKERPPAENLVKYQTSPFTHDGELLVASGGICISERGPRRVASSCPTYKLIHFGT